MSDEIRAALEVGMGTISPALATAYENVAFTPPALDTPYQRLFMRPARPINDEISTSRFIEQGFMQVDLLYPLNKGAGAATARAKLIRSTFRNGASFTAGGVTTRVAGTPEITEAYPEADRWRQTVRIRYRAQIAG